MAITKPDLTEKAVSVLRIMCRAPDKEWFAFELTSQAGIIFKPAFYRVMSELKHSGLVDALVRRQDLIRRAAYVLTKNGKTVAQRFVHSDAAGAMSVTRKSR